MPYPEFVSVDCPNCTNTLVLYHDQIGSAFICVHCGKEITITVRGVSNDPQPIDQRHIC